MRRGRRRECDDFMGAVGLRVSVGDVSWAGCEWD